MNEFWSQRVCQSQPYVAGEQPQDRQYIKLNTNENPYPPSPQALAAMTQGVDGRMRLYPDPEATALREALAAYHQLTPQHIFVGNGSDEVLAFTFLAFFNPGDRVNFPDITYSFYPVYANIFGLTMEQFPLDANFAIPLDRLAAIPGGLILANPNAPTGRSLSRQQLEAVISGNPRRLVVVDEAYVDFGGESAVPLLADYPNLLVVQTFSKSRSLAGLRVGFALGQPELIEGLERIKNSINSYTLDRLALLGSQAALADDAYFTTTCYKIIQTREKLAQDLAGLGFQVVPSQANFLLVTHPGRTGEALFGALRERGILVRHFNKPRIADYLRITIGTPGEMDALVDGLVAILAEGGPGLSTATVASPGGGSK